MLTRRIFKNCLVALMCLTFVAAGCGDDNNNDSNNGTGGELSDADNNGASDGGTDDGGSDDDGGNNQDGSNEDVDPNYDPCNDPDNPDAYCPCEEGESYCHGECVNVNGSSPDHCGACGASCNLFAECQQGTCICDDPDATYCDGYCISLEEDKVNCGECGNVCDSGNVCYDSTCLTLPERIAYEINEARKVETSCSGGTLGPSEPVRLDPYLSAPAQEHAEDMAANDGEAQGDLNQRIQESDFEGQATGGVMFPGTGQPQAVTEALLGDYCSDVLGDIDALGVGVAGDVDSRHWVVLFGQD